MKARIVYASMTGNDEDMADILEEDLQDYGLTLKQVMSASLMPMTT